MPGRAIDPETLQSVGGAVTFVAIVSYVLVGWQFGSDSGTQTILAVLAVVAVLGALLYRRAGA